MKSNPSGDSLEGRSLRHSAGRRVAGTLRSEVAECSSDDRAPRPEKGAGIERPASSNPLAVFRDGRNRSDEGLSDRLAEYLRSLIEIFLGAVDNSGLGMIRCDKVWGEHDIGVGTIVT